MPQRHRPPPALTVDPHSVWLCSAYLDASLDALIDARRSLGPPTTWSPPSSALLVAVDDDVESARHQARVREVRDRIVALAPDLETHVDELQGAARDAATRAAEVGFAVGVEIALGQRRDSALDLGGAETTDGTVPNRET